MIRNILFAITLLFFLYGGGQVIASIDVVILATKKDIATLNLCIAGIKENGRKIRRVIVVSDEKFTDKAEWFDEKMYPFSKFEVAYYLNGQDESSASQYMSKANSRVGWYYQQLLKLYAPFVIPGISSDVLILDSDTIFFRPVEFINKQGKALYNPGSENWPPYFIHANKLLPGLKKLYPEYSGISHHMLFQLPVLEDLFNQVEMLHQVDFWKAFCLCIDPQQLNDAGASEYEIYFNFVFAQSRQVSIRKLKWKNSGHLQSIPRHKKAGFDYVTYHSYMR